MEQEQIEKMLLLKNYSSLINLVVQLIRRLILMEFFLFCKDFKIVL